MYAAFQSLAFYSCFLKHCGGSVKTAHHKLPQIIVKSGVFKDPPIMLPNTSATVIQGRRNNVNTMYMGVCTTPLACPNFPFPSLIAQRADSLNSLSKPNNIPVPPSFCNLPLGLQGPITHSISSLIFTPLNVFKLNT